MLVLGSWNALSTVHGLLTIAAAVLYVGGTIGITMVCNVPLNNGLAMVDPASGRRRGDLVRLLQ